jgi:hypothetical protein
VRTYGSTKVIVDLTFRKTDENFHPDDPEKLQAPIIVTLARDERTPSSNFEAVIKSESVSVVSPGWRCAPVFENLRLPAIFDVEERHLSSRGLDLR